ncbi:MAG: AraC family transcriptional regulator [Bacteroidota bacterium]
MSSVIKTYHTIAEFIESLGGTLDQDYECTVNRLENVHPHTPFSSPTFRTNYYSIVMLSTGNGMYHIDGNSYTTRSQTVYFTNPGHVKGFELHAPSSGYIITFSEGFLKEYVHRQVFDEFPFLIAEVAPPQFPNPESFDQLRQLCEYMIHIYEGSLSSKPKLLGSQLNMLLLYIKEFFWGSYDPLEESDSGSQIVAIFRKQVDEHFKALISGQTDAPYLVQDYADQQFLHPNYLNTVIKKKTGKSVNTWISERMIAEARGLLKRTSAPVKEIAYQLGYKEPGHFSRFFKKQTGISPSEYRGEREEPTAS